MRMEAVAVTLSTQPEWAYGFILVAVQSMKNLWANSKRFLIQEMATKIY